MAIITTSRPQARKFIRNAYILMLLLPKSKRLNVHATVVAAAAQLSTKAIQQTNPITITIVMILPTNTIEHHSKFICDRRRFP